MWFLHINYVANGNKSQEDERDEAWYTNYVLFSAYNEY